MNLYSCVVGWDEREDMVGWKGGRIAIEMFGSKPTIG